MRKLQMGDSEQAAFVRMTKGINLFASGLSTGLMEKILSFVSLYEFGEGEKVFSQGDPGDAFFAVLSGRLKVSVREAFLFSRKLAELREGDIFGEMALLDGSPRSATVTCLAPSRLFVLLRRDFLEVLRVNPDFAAEIGKIAEDRFFSANRARFKRFSKNAIIGGQ